MKDVLPNAQNNLFQMSVSAQLLFFRWFTNAVHALRALPYGDGGIAAFMITLPLVERAAIGRLKLKGHEKISDDLKRAEIGEILGLSVSRQRSIFWDMFRNGFLHLGMPLNGKTLWRFSGSFGALPVFKEIEGRSYVCVNPWAFAEHILKLYQDDPRLIDCSESAPFGDIFESE